MVVSIFIRGFFGLLGLWSARFRTRVTGFNNEQGLCIRPVMRIANNIQSSFVKNKHCRTHSSVKKVQTCSLIKSFSADHRIFAFGHGSLAGGHHISNTHNRYFLRRTSLPSSTAEIPRYANSSHRSAESRMLSFSAVSTPIIANTSFGRPLNRSARPGKVATCASQQAAVYGSITGTAAPPFTKHISLRQKHKRSSEGSLTSSIYSRVITCLRMPMALQCQSQLSFSAIQQKAPDDETQRRVSIMHFRHSNVRHSARLPRLYVIRSRRLSFTIQATCRFTDAAATGLLIVRASATLIVSKITRHDTINHGSALHHVFTHHAERLAVVIAEPPQAFQMSPTAGIRHCNAQNTRMQLKV